MTVVNSTHSFRHRRLWLWFVAGFLIVFVAMLIFVTMFSMNSSGESLTKCRLWQYYFLEVQRSLQSTRVTGQSSAIVETAIQHLAISFVGGVVMFGLGWAIRKRS